MTEELNEANARFEELYKKLKETQKKLPKNKVVEKGILYFFFISGIKFADEDRGIAV